MRLINGLLVIALAASLALVALGLATPEFEFSTELYVAAPVEETYGVFRDPDNLIIWLDGFVSIQYLRGEPDAVGAFYRLTFERDDEVTVFTEEVTGLIDNELVSMTLSDPRMTVELTTRFTSEGAGTRILTSSTVRPTGVFYRALLRLRRKQMQDTQRSDYERLKRLIESG